MTTTTGQTYEVEGRLLEVCTCNVLCPCWVGEDPDGDGTCDSILGWYVDRGTVQGVDVSDRCLCVSVHIPGNVLAGNWKAAVLVDDRCSEEQQRALLVVFTGQLGGAVADLAALIGEVVAVERVPITFDVVDGKGHIRIGDVAEARLTPVPGLRTGRRRRCTTRCSPPSPAHPPTSGKAETFRRDGSRHGLPDVAVHGPERRAGLIPVLRLTWRSRSRAARGPPRPGPALWAVAGAAGCCSPGSLAPLGSPITTAWSRALRSGTDPSPRADDVRGRLAGDGGGDDVAEHRADGADVRRRDRPGRATHPGTGGVPVGLLRRLARLRRRRADRRRRGARSGRHLLRGCATRDGLVLAGALALAGVAQFTPLTRRCLRACRDPRGFLFQHYRRGRPQPGRWAFDTGCTAWAAAGR